MAVKNHKPTQARKGAPEQSKSYSAKTGGNTAHPHATKFVVRSLSQSSPISSPKVHAIGGHKRKIHIKPLPPRYPDSLFQSKEEYDAMVREVVKNAKNGEAVMRNAPLPQDID